MRRTFRAGLAIILVLTSAAYSVGVGEAPYPLRLWKDPAFKRQFMGEYGMASEIEPSLSDIERKQMDKLSAFMSDKPEDCYKALAEVTNEKSSAQFDFVLGQLSVQTGRPLERTVAHYEAAIKKFQDFRRAHYALGRLLTQEAKYEAALRFLSKAVELGRADGTLYGLMAYCHLAANRAGSAESAYRMALVLQPNSLDWKMGLVRALFMQSKADDTIALCDEMLAADPGKTELWQLQANAFLLKKDYLRAATNLEMVARGGKATAQDFLRLGNIYLNEQLPDAALSAYVRALGHATPIALNEAVAVVESTSARGALDPARELLATVRKNYAASLTDPDRRRLMKIEARIAVADGRGGESVKILEEVVQLDPLDGDALMLLAGHYAGNGEKDKAILFYERAAGVDAFEADALLRHAQLLVGMSKATEALPLLKRSDAKKPRDSVKKFIEELERFQKLRR